MHTKRVALVTGANQGIGLQIAKDLVANGFTVFVGSRDLARGVEAARTIDGDARAVQLDVTDRGSLEAAAKHVRDTVGRLDVLVNNAAISNTTMRSDETVEQYARRTPASKITFAELRAIWETNVFGALATYQVMLPLLRESPSARIVNVSSGVGSLTRASDLENPYRSIFGPGYSASKAGMNAMSIAMAIELEGTGIKVNACSPGFTKTNLNKYQGHETVEQGAAEAVRLALLGPDGPTGTFSGTLGPLPW